MSRKRFLRPVSWRPFGCGSRTRGVRPTSLLAAAVEASHLSLSSRGFGGKPTPAALCKSPSRSLTHRSTRRRKRCCAKKARSNTINLFLTGKKRTQTWSQLCKPFCFDFGFSPEQTFTDFNPPNALVSRGNKGRFVQGDNGFYYAERCGWAKQTNVPGHERERCRSGLAPSEATFFPGAQLPSSSSGSFCFPPNPRVSSRGVWWHLKPGQNLG